MGAQCYACAWQTNANLSNASQGHSIAWSVNIAPCDAAVPRGNDRVHWRGVLPSGHKGLRMHIHERTHRDVTGHFVRRTEGSPAAVCEGAQGRVSNARGRGEAGMQ